jgi:hypothetical protein
MKGRTHIRCSVSDCDWGFILSQTLDISDSYEPFRLRCINQHGLNADDTESMIHLDLKKLLLTLIKR